MQICHLPRRRTITSALSAVKMLSLILLSIGVITANLPYIVAVSVDDRNDGGGKSIVFFFFIPTIQFNRNVPRMQIGSRYGFFFHQTSKQSKKRFRFTSYNIEIEIKKSHHLVITFSSPPGSYTIHYYITDIAV